MKSDAHEAYTQRAGAVAVKIEELQRALTAHAARERADRSNWGLAGDLGRLLDVLDEALQALGAGPER